MSHCKIYFSVLNGRPSLEQEFTEDCLHWFGLFSCRELMDFNNYVSIRDEQQSPMDCFLKAVEDLTKLEGYLTDCQKKYDAVFYLDMAVWSSFADSFHVCIENASCLEILTKFSFRICVKTGEDFGFYEQDYHPPVFDDFGLVY